MSRESTLIVLGLLVIISPFIGLPLSVLAWILPILGVLIVLIGVTLRALRGRVRATPQNEPTEQKLS